MSDEWIRVSEIPEYLYCHRSWWLQHSQGVESANVREIEGGTQYHQAHGRDVQRALLLRRFVYVCVGLGTAVLIYWLLR